MVEQTSIVRQYHGPDHAGPPTRIGDNNAAGQGRWTGPVFNQLLINDTDAAQPAGETRRRIRRSPDPADPAAADPASQQAQAQQRVEGAGAGEGDRGGAWRAEARVRREAHRPADGALREAAREGFRGGGA